MIIRINGMIVVEKIIPLQLLELLEPTQISSHNQALFAHDIIILLREKIGDLLGCWFDDICHQQSPSWFKMLS